MARQENQEVLRYRIMTPLIYHQRVITHKRTASVRVARKAKMGKSPDPGALNGLQGLKPFNRKLFPITNTLDNPMAAPANTGLKPQPHGRKAPAATGIRIAL
jgi:hypothetical protein